MFEVQHVTAHGMKYYYQKATKNPQRRSLRRSYRNSSTPNLGRNSGKRETNASPERITSLSPITPTPVRSSNRHGWTTAKPFGTSPPTQRIPPTPRGPKPPNRCYLFFQTVPRFARKIPPGILICRFSRRRGY